MSRRPAGSLVPLSMLVLENSINRHSRLMLLQKLQDAFGGPGYVGLISCAFLSRFVTVHHNCFEGLLARRIQMPEFSYSNPTLRSTWAKRASSSDSFFRAAIIRSTLRSFKSSISSFTGFNVLRLSQRIKPTKKDDSLHVESLENSGTFTQDFRLHLGRSYYSCLF